MYIISEISFEGVNFYYPSRPEEHILKVSMSQIMYAVRLSATIAAMNKTHKELS